MDMVFDVPDKRELTWKEARESVIALAAEWERAAAGLLSENLRVASENRARELRELVVKLDMRAREAVK